jgi:hypothetical protein
MKPSRDALLLIGLLAVAVIFAIMSGTKLGGDSNISTSYSNYGSGVKAVYTLLGDRLGYNVDRLLTPYTDMPEDARVLVVVAPLASSPIRPDEQRALDRWIQAGGTAVFISHSLKNIPSDYGTNRTVGKGHIYALNSRRVITNKGAHDYHNPLKVVSIVAEHAKPGDLVLFDEYHHGLGRSQLQSVLLHIQGQVKAGAIIVGLALLALCYSKGRRFGAVRRLPAQASLRPEFEFVESIGRLYDRAGAADVAADILLNSLRQELCLRLGVSSDAPREMIARRLDAEGKKSAARRVKRLLAEGAAGQRTSKSELLSIAQEIHLVEKELGLGRTNG